MMEDLRSFEHSIAAREQLRAAALLLTAAARSKSDDVAGALLGVVEELQRGAEDNMASARAHLAFRMDPPRERVAITCPPVKR